MDMFNLDEMDITDFDEPAVTAYPRVFRGILAIRYPLHTPLG
jgi:hypothetical protein